MKRVFVGLELPESARAALGVVARELERELPGLAPHWVDPKNFHVTVVFIGAWAVARLAALEPALAGVAAEQAALILGLAGIGAFPSLQDPRTLWAGLAGDTAALAALYAAVVGALRPLGVTPEARPFAPHVTLARCKAEADLAPPRVEAAAAARAGRAIHPPFAAAHLTLFESRPGPRGSVYAPLFRAALAARPSEVNND